MVAKKTEQPNAQTFNDPNEGFVFDKEKAALVKKEIMDSDEIDTLNKEVAEEHPIQGVVSVEDVFLDESQDDPILAVMSASDAQEMQSYTQADLDKDVQKENLAREFFRKWQARQSDWTAFIYRGFDEKSKRTMWEKRVYRIHDVIQEDADKLQQLLWKLENIETRKNYLQFLGARTQDNYEEYISTNWGKEIAVLVKQIRNLKFQIYFGETNPGIMEKIRKIDMRDLIDAAERREEKLPPSRKLQSSRSTLRGNIPPTNEKEVSSTNKSPGK